MVSSQALVKLASPTNSPGSPTRMLVSENHSAITNGYAMNNTRMSTPGVSRAAASRFSLSSKRVRRETRPRSAGAAMLAAPPAPATTGSFKACRSGVNLAQLGRGPLHRLLGLHLAVRRLRVHIDDDVFVPRFGGLLRRRAGEAHVPAPAPRVSEGQHDRIGVPHLVLLPLSRRPYRETLLHDEPLLVVGRRMRPTQK